MRRFGALLLIVAATGCAYFNGVYNARQAEKRGDAALRKGRDGEAASYFATVAEKAETVLVRHGDSKWADDARLLAGRGWARAGQCSRAVPHLEYALAHDGLTGERLELAHLALGICRIESGALTEAESLLVMVMESGDRWRSSQGAIWAARSALRRGDTEKALGYLAETGTSVAEWELVIAFVRQEDFARAESLLTRRAEAGDYRPELLGILPQLWMAGGRSGIATIVQRYDSARLRPGQRARLHLTYGDLLEQAGEDSAAKVHFGITEQLLRDSLPGRQAAVRLTALTIRELETMTDVENVIARTHDAVEQVPLQVRLEHNLIFLNLLLNRTDYTGASQFLAAEVARDSLGAHRLARQLFLRVPDAYGNSPVAPKALLAAAALAPDSAESYIARLRQQYPTSVYTLALDGRDTPLLGRISRGDQLLQQAWAISAKAMADTLSARKRAEEQQRNPNVATTVAPAPSDGPPQ